MDNKIEQVKKIITDLCDGCEVDGVSTGLIEIASKEIVSDLYSSQEPKVVPCKFEDWDDTQESAICQCTLVDDSFDTSNRCGHIGDVTDCPLYKPATPTEGMLEQIEAVSKSFYDKYAGKGLSPSEVMELHKSEYWELIGQVYCRQNLSQAQLAKVLSNLPTEQEIRESERKEIGEDLRTILLTHEGLAGIKAITDYVADTLLSQSPKEV